MRPTIVHLIDDTKLGGVNLALQSLAASKLNLSFYFKLIFCQFNYPQFKRYHADVIVIHGSISWQKLPAFLALKLANIGTPIFYQEHHYSREFMHHCVQRPARFRLMLKLGYALMSKVLLVSKAQVDWLADIDVLSPRKMVLVGQGKQLKDFVSLPKATRHQPLKLLAYGRLSQQKGFDMLIKAMTNLPSDKVELAIAGEGEQQDTLLSLTKPLKHVHLVGEVSDVPSFLASGDVVVVPSRWEPFGLTCQEAITAGRGVIVANVDGLADQVADLQQRGDGYQVINELTAAGIEQAIWQVIENKHFEINTQQRLLGEQAWKAVLDNWQRLLDETLP
ncbi:glycosyltransferase [Shewanella sp. 10N.261.52.F9]|uniref:glycosyltransferase n=1 Tax=Shewanella sp. 10N.261.52.F9 TaxID=3229684 RepID=UPI00354CCBDD